MRNLKCYQNVAKTKTKVYFYEKFYEIQNKFGTKILFDLCENFGSS